MPADISVRKPDPESQPPTGAAESDQKVEIAAVRLLARREHGTRELKRKLTAKGHGAESVDRVVEKLGSKNLVCDQRFVSSFISHHARRGQGPVKIKAELRQHGVPDADIEAGLQAAQQDWARIACGVRLRKFGTDIPRAASERAKQARFLQYRGFTADQIRIALHAHEGGGEGQYDADPGADPAEPDWLD